MEVIFTVSLSHCPIKDISQKDFISNNYYLNSYRLCYESIYDIAVTQKLVGEYWEYIRDLEEDYKVRNHFLNELLMEKIYKK